MGDNRIGKEDRNLSKTRRPRLPPAQEAAIPKPVTSSSGVGTYGGLNISKSMAPRKRGSNEEAKSIVTKSTQGKSSWASTVLLVAHVANGLISVETRKLLRCRPFKINASEQMTYPLPLPISRALERKKYKGTSTWADSRVIIFPSVRVEQHLDQNFSGQGRCNLSEKDYRERSR